MRKITALLVAGALFGAAAGEANSAAHKAKPCKKQYPRMHRTYVAHPRMK